MGPFQFKNLILPISVMLAGIIFGGFYYAAETNKYKSLEGQPQARIEQGNEEKQESGSTEQQSEKLDEQSPSPTAVGEGASQPIDKQPSWDPSEYTPSNKPLTEQLKTDGRKLYVNPEIRLAFKYPPTWNLGSNHHERHEDSLGLWDFWSVTLDTTYDARFEEMSGILNIQVHPVRKEEQRPAGEPYGKVADTEALVTSGNGLVLISLVKDTYFINIAATRIGDDAVRSVVETLVIEPSLENLTPDQKAVFQTNQWQPYINSTIGFGFMYPPEWITAEVHDFTTSEEANIFFLVEDEVRIRAVKATTNYENALERALSDMGSYPPQNTKSYGEVSGANILLATEGGRKIFFFTQNNYVFAVMAGDRADLSTVEELLKTFVFTQ